MQQVDRQNVNSAVSINQVTPIFLCVIIWDRLEMVSLLEDGHSVLAVSIAHLIFYWAIMTSSSQSRLCIPV